MIPKIDAISDVSDSHIVRQILDAARWAPSGDNTQPWRFELVDDLRFVIHGHDTRSDCVYDLDGRPSQISLGALIETASIAASAHGLALSSTRRQGLPDDHPTFDITLARRPGLAPDPLLAWVATRSVQRRPYKVRPLATKDMASLAESVGPHFKIQWACGWRLRRQWAGLLWQNAKLRLTMPEAFEVHRRVIEWDARQSKDRIPDRALGADPLTLQLMRWAMASWPRVNFLNTWLGGTIAPRLAMDLWPALACAGHVAIVAARPPTNIDDFVAAGRAVQRFWLTATAAGLQHQPEMTPIIFRRYAQENRAFTVKAELQTLANQLAARFESLAGAATADRVVWLGRIGYGSGPAARSIRKPLRDLMLVGNKHNPDSA